MMGTSCCSPLVFCWLLCNVRQREVNSSPILRPVAACKPHCEESRWLSFRIKSHAGNYKSALLYPGPDSQKPSRAACGTAEPWSCTGACFVTSCLWKPLIEIWCAMFFPPSDEGPEAAWGAEGSSWCSGCAFERVAPALQGLEGGRCFGGAVFAPAALHSSLQA